MVEYSIQLKYKSFLHDSKARREAREKLKTWCKGKTRFTREAVAQSVFNDLPHDIQKHCEIVELTPIYGIL